MSGVKRVRITKSSYDTWYEIGQHHDICSEFGDWYITDTKCGLQEINKSDCEVVMEDDLPYAPLPVIVEEHEISPNDVLEDCRFVLRSELIAHVCDDVLWDENEDFVARLEEYSDKFSHKNNCELDVVSIKEYRLIWQRPKSEQRYSVSGESKEKLKEVFYRIVTSSFLKDAETSDLLLEVIDDFKLIEED